MRIILDGMGGDHAPAEIVKGAVEAAALIPHELVLVGKQEAIEEELRKCKYTGNQIKIVNADAQVHVYCSNPEKAPVKRQFCKVPCLGCRKCEKTLPGKFKFDGFHAVIDYEAETFPNAEDIRSVGCPTQCLLSASEHYAIEHSDPDHENLKETE